MMVSYFSLGILKQSDQFSEKLKQVPQAPCSSSDKDAVGTLLDICVQRNWPIATYVIYTMQ